MSATVTESNLKQKEIEAKKNTFVAYEIGEYYYSLGDYPKSVEWYEHAVSGVPVVPLALYALGYACQNGQGTPVDLIRAFQYYEAAAEKDVPQACYNLAFFYQNGIAVARNSEKANYYCERASETLKKLTNDSQEIKAELYKLNLDYSQTVLSVLELQNEWNVISNEAEEKSQIIGKLESGIDSYKSTISELEMVIESQKSEIVSQKDQYDKILMAHNDALRLIDKLNDDIRKLRYQMDELRNQCSKEALKNGVILGNIQGRNVQLENEKNTLHKSQDKYHKDLLTSQEQINGLKNQLSIMANSNNSLRKEMEVQKEKMYKMRMKKNILLGMSTVLIIALIVIINIFFL